MASRKRLGNTRAPRTERNTMGEVLISVCQHCRDLTATNAPIPLVNHNAPGGVTEKAPPVRIAQQGDDFRGKFLIRVRGEDADFMPAEEILGFANGIRDRCAPGGEVVQYLCGPARTIVEAGFQGAETNVGAS